MKIAEVAPLYESVPPKYYGGTERIVSYLTEALVEMGHDVTLFASGKSVTKANFLPQCSCPIRLNPDCKDQTAPHVLMKEKIYQQVDEFDIIHSHVDYLLFPMMRRVKTPIITTLHGRLDYDEIKFMLEEFTDAAVTSVSNKQREPMPHSNWQGTVYHGLPKDLLHYNEKAEPYLAFLGRISVEKRVDRAIEIAKRVGMKLKIAAKIDKDDKEYFEAEIKHLLDHPLIEYIGEIGEKEKQEFLGNAYALLFPIDWPEPFGLVMIEAMACGTPIIAHACGSVPEVMEDGGTGFIVNNIDEAVAAVNKISTISRKGCREIFERRFTAKCMAENYLKIFQSFAKKIT